MLIENVEELANVEQSIVEEYVKGLKASEVRRNYIALIYSHKQLQAKYFATTEAKLEMLRADLQEHIDYGDL